MSILKIYLPQVKRVRIKTKHIKLDALLKFASVVSSGGEAKILIQNGDVFVNSGPCEMRGKKIFPGDTVRINETVIMVIGESEKTNES